MAADSWTATTVRLVASRIAFQRTISAVAIALWSFPPAANPISSAVVLVDPPSRLDRASTSLHPELTINGASASQRERLDLAVHRFTDLGLSLPDLEVRFVGGQDSCQGHMGLFDAAPSPWRVTICSEASFVYEHELAHAWAHANLTDERRTDFMKARGLSVWSDPAVPWSERGVEDVAFVIQQGLAGLPLPPVFDAKHQALFDAFELLTGRQAPILREWKTRHQHKPRNDLASRPPHRR